MSTGERHKISKEVFEELEMHRFETLGETQLLIYKDGEAAIEDFYIVKVPIVCICNRNHNEYILEA